MKRLLLLFACAPTILSLAFASFATEITEIRPGTSPVPLYGKFEVEFDLSNTYVNPFDPDEVEATLQVAPPSGGTLVIPAFWYQDYARSNTGTDEILAPVGDPCWLARFAPTESGVYTYYIEVTDSEGYVSSSDATFNCELSADRGYVRPDPSDSRLFTFDDGLYYLPVGENVCWASNLGTYDYDTYFTEMEASGQNWSRIWMTDFYRGQSLEWNEDHWTGYFHGIGVYSLECAWKLDYIMELAREKGIYLQLVTQHHGQLNSTFTEKQWADNPYNSANGGMLSSPEQFFTNAEAKDLYKRKTRYTIARWGYATSILCWEFWNEVQYTDNYNASAVTDWHEEMAQYVESIDPWEHMLTTSVSADPTTQLSEAVWSLPEIDCTQLHLYVGEITNNIRNKTVSMWTHDKPVIVGEFGCWPLDDRFGDTDGTHIHNAIWSGAMTMTGAMTWWWDDYIHPNDLYYHYAGLSSFFQGEDLRDPALDILDPVVVGARGYGIGAGDRAYVWIQDPDNVLGGTPGGTLSGVTIEVPDMTTGPYDVEYWSTFSGTITSTEVVTCTDGTLRLDIPDFDLDLALKARRQADNTPPSVTVTAPNGGETWYIDSFFDIMWSASDNVGVTSIDILLSRDGGTTYPETIATGETNDGTYSWQVTGPPDTDIRVKVKAYDAATNSGEDESDAAFTIGVDPLSVSVTLVPATHVMACDENITCHVNVDDDAIDLMGADYKLNYDATKLSFVSATVGDLLNTGAGEYIFTYLSSPGVLQINSSHLSTGVNGPGEIAEITFQAASATVPTSTALTFSDAELRNSGNQTLPSTWTGASVVIDCVAPTISVTLDAPVSPWTCYNTAPTVNISAADDYDLDCVKYDVDGGGSWTDLVCGLSGTSYPNTPWPLPGFGGLSQGSHTYNFKSTDDAGNESTVASVTFTKDTVDPSAVTDFVATVRHNQIILDWTNPGGDVDRIYLYRNDWTSYPGYGTADPGYPTVGGYDLQADVGAAETYTDIFSNTTRGIYAYRAVVYDCAGNYAAAGSDDYDRATSYYLGDIASGAGSWGPNYDGLVSGFDYNVFSGCYWSAPPTGNCMEFDFGPTIEPTRGNFGIPVPDAYVDFDDLMIFAMNYGNVPPPPAPLGAPLLGIELASVGLTEEAGSYRLSLIQVSQADGVVELALVVEGNEMFKGLSAEIEYDHSGLEFMSALPSEALLGGSRVLFMGGEVDGVLRIDFAALGGEVAIGGNGPVATLSFRRSGETGSSVRITSADARDVENNVLILEFDGGASVEPGMPVMFALRGNSPNPFAGSTEIRFDVPREASVSLRIYNIQGQIVQTLVDGTVSAGRHAETWDGSDGRGHSLPSGVYFVKMIAGNYEHMVKVLKLH